MTETVRLQVDIERRQLDELEKLQKSGGLRTKRELWDTAFTLLKWASKKRAQGLLIGSLNENGVFTELEMPFLEQIAAEARSSESDSNSQEQTRIHAVTNRIPTTAIAARAVGNGASAHGLPKGRQRR